MICSKAESHTKRSRTLNGRALLMRPAPARHGHRHEHRAGLGQRKEGSRSWPRAVLRLGRAPSGGEAPLPSGPRGWCLVPGCSADLFPGSAQLQGRHGLPQHASEGSLPAPHPSRLLLLPLSLPRLCFLQQLRTERGQSRVTQEGGRPGPTQAYCRTWEAGGWAPAATH